MITNWLSQKPILELSNGSITSCTLVKWNSIFFDVFDTLLLFFFSRSSSHKRPQDEQIAQKLHHNQTSPSEIEVSQNAAWRHSKHTRFSRQKIQKNEVLDNWECCSFLSLGKVQWITPNPLWKKFAQKKKQLTSSYCWVNNKIKINKNK